MLDFTNLQAYKNNQPYYIYKRVQLTSPEGYFLHAIDYGFWYLLRRVHVKFPEVDTAGAVFYPQLNLYAVERASNKISQNVPIPFRLIGTPASEGVTVTAGNQMTATGIKNVKLLNKVLPFRDNLEFYISGQNPIGDPPFIDVVCIGYLISDNELSMWNEVK